MASPQNLLPFYSNSAILIIELKALRARMVIATLKELDAVAGDLSPDSDFAKKLSKHDLEELESLCKSQ